MTNSITGFDMALYEIARRLCYGATRVLKDPRDSFRHLNNVNATFLTPSLLSALSPEEQRSESRTNSLAMIISLRMYILDQQMYLVPQGVTEEIYISGEQVVCRYWSGTIARATDFPFSSDPFASEDDHRPLYRTRDLGYWYQHMEVVYKGRTNNQVKVRGFRVELEEIKRALVPRPGGLSTVSLL
ncbi:hypothetical protein F4780DRAFT_781404 [Xylariomycetidae sp. FL0641]|nr:hypothetical protein F4780DRAFT_781404 [Xylariomycetidae sp. FL0641]